MIWIDKYSNNIFFLLLTNHITSELLLYLVIISIAVRFFDGALISKRMRSACVQSLEL